MRRLLCLSSLLFVCTTAWSAQLVSVTPLTDRILVVHVDEGYVIHHGKGQKRSDEKVVIAPLDVVLASKPEQYKVASAGETFQPVSIARKSKGTDFAWFVDSWVDGRAVNTRPDHTKEHWLYLHLPKPLREGQTYTVSTPTGAADLTYRSTSSRSEAVHVNLLGYVPAAPKKFAYVYHWMGDGGSLDLKSYAGKAFSLVDQTTKRSVYSGQLKFRKGATNPETFHVTDTPNANFNGADVYECDFSAFNKPGKYVVSVEGIGCSFPFRLDSDIYREAFQTTARGLYHNRSGIELKLPFTSFARPAPHNPKLTPNFAGKLQYTTSRSIDWVNEDHSADDKASIEKGMKGPLDVWGWYQDAGDWDSYSSHMRVPTELMFAFEMAPANFRDNELNIPESGNGIPDLLDEAAWLPRFGHRLRQELVKKGWGSGGIGLRVCGDHFGGDGEGVPSYLDVNRTWIVSGEDPVSTFRYAGTAAHLAHCLKLIGKADPQGVDWLKEARESYTWAVANTKSGDEAKVKAHRFYAAAALLRMTREETYRAQCEKDSAAIKADSFVWEGDLYGPAILALSGLAKPEVRAAILATADDACATGEKRAMRWGGIFSFPMLVGHQTTPWMLETAVAYTLTKSTAPAKAEGYLAALYTTCDYFLGTNSLNMTWVTGLGPRHPQQLFHMDAWYNGTGKMHPGMIPYGPWRKTKDVGQGPWDSDWPNPTLYPGIDKWPGNERWFENRCAPLNGEFTVHQNTGPAAALFGFLCGTGKP